ncbi:MAG: hypothetical protein ACXVP1_01765 [Thermoleophilia bacterium]
MGRLRTIHTLVVGTALGAASAILAPRLKRKAASDGDPVSRELARRQRASRAVAAFLGTPCAAENRPERTED